MTAADEARAEAERRFTRHASGYPSRRIFVEGAEWQASRPVTDEQVDVLAKAIVETRPNPGGGYDVIWEDAQDMARAALEAARGVQS